MIETTERRALNVEIPAATYRLLAVYAIDTRRRLYEIVAAALEDYIARQTKETANGKPGGD